MIRNLLRLIYQQQEKRKENKNEPDVSPQQQLLIPDFD
jgi:hypothetical protein